LRSPRSTSAQTPLSDLLPARLLKAGSKRIDGSAVRVACPYLMCRRSGVIRPVTFKPVMKLNEHDDFTDNAESPTMPIHFALYTTAQLQLHRCTRLIVNDRGVI